MAGKRAAAVTTMTTKEKDPILARYRNPELLRGLELLVERQSKILDDMFRYALPNATCPECEIVASLQAIGLIEHWVKRIEEELSKRKESDS